MYGGEGAHNLILVPHGDDFRYVTLEEANYQFQNLERLIDYMNSNEKMNVEVKFGTLSEYFELLKQKSEKRGKPLKTLSGDFFTYSDKGCLFTKG